MVLLFWLAAIGASGGLVWGIRAGWLEPTGLFYPGVLVGCGLLWGLAAGSGAGRAFAWLTRPVWGGLFMGLIAASGLVYGAIWSADWLLPPVYFREGSSLWQTLAPRQVIMAFSVAAAALSFPITFAFWRWWGR